MPNVNISAKIEGIRYKPFLCGPLNEYQVSEIESAFDKEGAFILNVGTNNQVALSWWVSSNNGGKVFKERVKRKQNKWFPGEY